jgi:hypothetical protein
MEHLPAATSQRTPHQKHLAAGIYANEKAVLVHSMTERLLAHREALGTALGHLVGGRRLEK